MIDVERSLRDLAIEVSFPEEANLAPAVLAHIEAAPRRRPRYAVLVPAVAAAALLVALLGFPGVRSAVADFLGIGGVRIERDAPAPTPAAELDLGEQVTLTEARAAVDFDVRVPEALGAPDEVFYDALVPGGQVTLTYRSDAGLPAAPGSRLGALVTQFPGKLGDRATATKVLGPGVSLEPARVGDAGAYWIAGEPHFIFYVGRDGEPREDSVRLAGNVLLWEEDGITYRIESTLTLRAALRIARSMR